MKPRPYVLFFTSLREQFREVAYTTHPRPLVLSRRGKPNPNIHKKEERSPKIKPYKLIRFYFDPSNRTIIEGIQPFYFIQCDKKAIV